MFQFHGISAVGLSGAYVIELRVIDISLAMLWSSLRICDLRSLSFSRAQAYMICLVKERSRTALREQCIVSDGARGQLRN